MKIAFAAVHLPVSRLQEMFKWAIWILRLAIQAELSHAWLLSNFQLSFQTHNQVYVDLH